MRQSKCTLSPSLWPRLPLLCILNIRQLEFHQITTLTRFVILILCFVLETVLFLLFVVGCGLSFLCCTLSLAVFYYASAFNQDVSKWNTGAVTSMELSKCIRSHLLCGHGAFRLLWCVVEYIRQLEVRRLTSLTRVVLVFCLWFETGPCCCCCLCGGFGLSFLCCTLLSSCSV